MQLLLNLLIILVIISWAVVIIIRTFRKVKVGGKCAVCDYDCAVKKFQEDRCQLYVFRLAVYFAEHPHPEPEKLRWHWWKDHRQ